MTISSELNMIEFVGDGTLGPYGAIPYHFFKDEDLTVWLRDNTTQALTLQTLNSDYSVAGANTPPTGQPGTPSGTITFLITAPTTGQTVVVWRTPPHLQTAAFPAFGGVPLPTYEALYDLHVEMFHIYQRDRARTLRLSDGAIGQALIIPPGSVDRVLALDSSGDLQLRLSTGTQFLAVATDPPDNALGAEGDLALTPIGKVYQKIGGVWVDTGINLLGLYWRNAWVNSTTYAIRDGVANGGSSYICILEHDSSVATTEPGTGATWETYWDVLAQGATAGGGDVTGPGSSIAGNVASFAGTSGKVIADGNKAAADLALATNMAGSTDAQVVEVDVGANKSIKHSGTLTADLARRNTINTFTKGQRKTMAAVSHAANTFTLDPDTANSFSLTGSGTAGRINAASVLAVPAPGTAIVANTDMAGEIRGETDASGSLGLAAGWQENAEIDIAASTKFTLYWEGFYNPITSAVEYAVVAIDTWSVST